MRFQAYVVALLGIICARAASAQDVAKPVKTEVEVHSYRPKKIAADDEQIAKLKVPSGFKIAKWAEGLENPQMIAVNKNGDVYVTRRGNGDCVLLRDSNGDGAADGGPKVVAEKKGMPVVTRFLQK